MTNGTTADARCRAAYHEAGHAVIAYSFGVMLPGITISPAPTTPAITGSANDWMHNLHDDPANDGVELAVAEWISCFIAGEVAEAIDSDRHWDYKAADVRDALALASTTSDGDVDEAWALVTWLLYRMRRTLREPATWARVQAVVAALLQDRTLNQRQMRHLLEGAR